ncbi:hypothetical protein [Psychroserpens sp.]|uniref:hypothetical protein n=1 Tax=Psychroserpens sp. TaxID=2020870 RepID=UPI001B0A2883|nr:hypothetical protein [Psychroserpens sp.]MBO6606410.1 hypothetical protein [Psychroserpens sp.]MBO6632707.1 hypothetical protein [Psychroserpens sp.]MBO6653114.1 hypothetical protein [Psychroserpens sp.]MBO6680858.1 hypothetical protein [Psychroserpens sp.]MBO6750184.1 hypothetical protein [Psychroserpens sp.]
MSHNLSPTVNHTTNINIYFNSVNAALKVAGLKPIKPGDTVPTLTQKALSQMEGMLTTKFNKTFPNNQLPNSNIDGGYMGPLSSVRMGTAPACAVQQIADDFESWGISSSGVPTEIAKQVTNHIVNQGGQAGFISGTHQLTSAENLYWMAGYLSINITQHEQGILYVFGASEGLNIN